jgi:hypothetical protein
VWGELLKQGTEGGRRRMKTLSNIVLEETSGRAEAAPAYRTINGRVRDERWPRAARLTETKHCGWVSS